MMEIGSKATGWGLATFLGRRVVVGQLVFSTLGGELFLAFPLPFWLVMGGPSLDGLDSHWLML